jgi:mRNA interferase RelE/StbE
VEECGATAMSWQIIVSPIAQKQLATITDRRVQQALDRAIGGLEFDPDKKGKPLTGKLAGCRSIRAVSQRYRVIYRMDAGLAQVVILTVGLRKEGDRADIYALAERLVRAGLLALLVLICSIADVL